MKLRSGFTLIELSIVLVIIGLIIGGVLAGKDLIEAAEIHAQISQIQQYNTAVYTFKLKYGYLPGDMPQAAVRAYGFSAATVRPGEDNETPGRGNGDDVLQGSDYVGNPSHPFFQGGETLWFWEDLSANSGLIEGTFNTATDALTNPNPLIGLDAIKPYLPLGKIGHNTSVMVGNVNGVNYYYLAAIGGFFGGGCLGAVTPVCIANGMTVSSLNDGLSTMEALGIDSKIDDGAPITGSVQYGNLIGGNPLVIGASALFGSNCYNQDTKTYSQPAVPNGVCQLAIKMQ